VVQTDSPTVALGVRLTLTKLLPTKVMLLLPDAAPLGKDKMLTIGESYVKTCSAVPIRSLVTLASTGMLELTGDTQVRLVDEIHEEVTQLVLPIAPVKVRSPVAKFIPYNVRLALPVAGALGRCGNVSTGASYENCTLRVPTITPTVNAKL
jgi:hypothetical protein